ncbi:hypothetical protein RFI_07055 [Reticulomyxa filosa]|uniref:Uncharacterized protein n=1 Tax=Reticulomyxa filosa TaxID=46433 RepID=X6NW04_RETFI|nr:hypothetical protein RFI_07055 [Reticulomyxa filosa]|eukprot:ETO30068.1 hypothetical protein RFI_07055 [Reticulomyxa filosa]
MWYQIIFLFQSQIYQIPNAKKNLKNLIAKKIKKKKERRLSAARGIGRRSRLSQERQKYLLPELNKDTKNKELHNSFLEHYKIGMLLNNIMRVQYYNTLFPATHHLYNTLINDNFHIPKDATASTNSSPSPSSTDHHSDDTSSINQLSQDTSQKSTTN